MMSLQVDVDRIVGCLPAGCGASRFTVLGDTVSFTIFKAEREERRVSVVYLNAKAYPKSGISIIAADNNNVQDNELESCHTLAERLFRISAPIELVVNEVLKVYGHVPISSSTASVVGSDIDMGTLSCNNSDNDGCESMDQDAGSDCGSDDSGSAGSEVDEEEEEDRELMIACGQRQGRWERWEDKCREASEAANAALEGLSHDEAAAKKQQIFKPKEAFMMLSKELLNIVKKQSFEIFVDSVGDDVYTWAVELASFDPKSSLYKDMQEIQRRYQFSTCKLVISFKRGLHPFYPPSVEVVRPHLRGLTATAVASHPLLKLGMWDPWRPVGDLIGQIKTFLEAAARVDLEHPMNDIKRFPASSYRPVEVSLARLNALSGLDLPIQDDPLMKELYASFSQDQDRMEALQEGSKKRAREAKQKEGKTVWAQGTGYGTGDRTTQNPVWDAAASELAQKARDEELRLLFDSLMSDVSYDLKLTSEEPSGEVGTSSASAQFSTPMGVTGSTPMPKAPREVQNIDPDPEACLSALTSSCLVDFLIREFKVASFSDMCSRAPYFIAILSLTKALARHGQARRLLWRQTHQGDGGTAGQRTVAEIMQEMLQPAQQYSRVTQPEHDKDCEEKRQTMAAEAAAMAAGVPPPPKIPSRVFTLQQESQNEIRRGLRLAGLVHDIVGLLSDGRLDRLDGEEAAGTSGSGGSLLNGYCEEMRPLQVDYIPELRTMSHHYASSLATEGVQPKARMSRLAREASSLQQLLPLNESSSVFVRIDENNSTLWRALITGPEDTPYSAGCFIFDLYFPPNYPSMPPQVMFKTTGGGRVRFNPNLYVNGKVCLSLLGTWEGGKGEGWNPAASSALQVLLSIQSLILVPEPYFNEPGYEARHKGDAGKHMSREYNKSITEGTIRYAMIDLLQHPPKELEAIIKTHFRLRRSNILDTTQAWVDAAEQWDTNHAGVLRTLREQLVPLLDKL